MLTVLLIKFQGVVKIKNEEMQDAGYKEQSKKSRYQFTDNSLTHGGREEDFEFWILDYEVKKKGVKRQNNETLVDRSNFLLTKLPRYYKNNYCCTMCISAGFATCRHREEYLPCPSFSKCPVDSSF